MEATMTRILFFGRVGERLGPEARLDMPAEGLPVREIRRLLAQRDEIAADALLRPDVRASVDLVVVGEEALARPGQEIAFFSLFSGG
jgi:molybdopterin synthase sulfur carrier subunit